VSERVLLGLVGAGIGASLSPALHEREAGRLGLRCLYRTIDLAELGLGPDAVGDVIAAARLTGFAGVNVTHPCKQTVIEHLDAVAPEAAALGAVNTVVFAGDRAVGHNTDATGFAEGFARGLPDAELRRVVLLGAGGAGAAVGHAALALGADRLTVVDLDGARAAALARSLGRRFGDERVRSGEPDALPDLLADADGLIHATPTGMAGRPGMPLPADLLHPGLWIADIVYRPLDTELLMHARDAGCRTLDGGRMVVLQAAASFALFTGVEPDRERMLRHFGRLVDRPAAAGAPAR
jgi:shikimate dehydrogenase